MFMIDTWCLLSVTFPSLTPLEASLSLDVCQAFTQLRSKETVPCDEGK